MQTLKGIVLSIIIAFSILSCAKKNADVATYLSKYSETIDSSWTQKIIKTNDEWKSILTPEQYYITREGGTEQPFTHDYHDLKERGIFVCISCNNPLFGKDSKFDSGTGWPSFFKPFSKKSIVTISDSFAEISGDKVSCARCDAHLGDVFKDGPQPTGLRYCIDGIALKFVSEQK